MNPNKAPFRTLSALLLTILLLLNACSEGGGGDDSNSATELDEETASSFTSRCGVYENGSFVEIPKRAELVSIEVIGSDTVIISRTEGSQTGNVQLVRLHGIQSAGISSYRIIHGISILKEKLAGGGYFVNPGRNCEVVVEGGGLGVVGQIYSLSGENMSELMIAQGSAVPAANACGGDILSECYQTIPLTDRPFSDIELDIQPVSIASACGAVKNGAVQNPISKAELVKITALSSTQVVATPLLGLNQGNQMLVQLHGLGSLGLSNTANRGGINYISSSTTPEAYLVTESHSCVFEDEISGRGTMGQVYTKDGISVNEELVKRGYAFASSGGVCSASLLEPCYAELQASAPVITDVIAPPPSTGGGSGGGHDENTGFPPQDGYYENLIRNFLWKPTSESNGNLVILVNPLNVRIVVEGNATETLRNIGESNGRGTTARANRSGCAFGSNVRVTFFNAQNQPIPVSGNSPDGFSVIVPNGCNRMEFRR